MNDFSIRDSFGNELGFRGVIVAQADRKVTLGEDPDRRFLASVYALEGGGFVAQLEYLSTCHKEKPLISVEEVDTLNDVENVYFIFDVNEVLCDERGMSRDEKQARANVARSVRNAYESMLFKFLDETRIQTAKQNYKDRIVVPPKGIAATLWKLVGG